MNSTRWRRLLPGAAVAIVLGAISIYVFARREAGSQPEPTPRLVEHEAPAPGEHRELSPEELSTVRDLVAHALMPEDTPSSSKPALSRLPSGPVLAYVALRASGRRLATAWHGPAPTAEALEGALRTARQALAEGALSDVTTVEVNLGHSRRPVKGPPANIRRGLWGLEVHKDGRVHRFAPTEMLAQNRSFVRQLDLLSGSSGRWRKEGFLLHVFDAHQVLVTLGEHPEAVQMYRGNRLIQPADVTRENVRALAKRMSDYMVHAVQKDGRIVYRYFPSAGDESKANNMIRQWMATVCLGRIAREQEAPNLLSLLDKNIRYNLENYYGLEEGRGLIQFQGKVKLGAVALAAMALVEHPGRASYADYEQALLRTVDHLWQPDGSFRTFYKPERRNDNQNFYPGEALLLWATLYHAEESRERLARFMKSYQHYKAWHLENRNPAFIPWHTQAYYIVWRKTQNPDLRDWIFEMNDWLLDMQQIETAPTPDTVGRFYDPKRPFGPPHASSTGVYLEGLIDAYALAREVGDDGRAQNYRRAIGYGLLSLMHLEFGDEVDMFYVSRKQAVRGGIRTNPYDNTIRIDNVQHNLMALQKILRVFEEADYTRSMAEPSINRR